MAGEKRVYRLFKVAKELNVGTAMLVEHLEKNGHSVKNSPNTKLSISLYDMLLKEFASEKLMKEKADQLAERRREEVRGPAKSPEEEEKTSVEDEKEHLSAEDLRSTITVRPKRNRAANPTPEKKEELVTAKAGTPTPPPPPPQKQDPPKVSVPIEPPNEEEANLSSLKVLGKIDLDAISGRKPKKKPKAKAEPAKQDSPPKEKPAPKVEAPKVETPPKVESPPKVAADVTPKEVPVKPKAEAPKQEPPKEKAPKKEMPKKETPVVAKADPKAKPAEVPSADKPVEAPKEVKANPEAEQEEKVIRAGDRAPKLSGLKVMGKIELPGARKPKKKTDEEDKDKKKTSGEGGSSEDDSGRKRRRRRKRKRKPSEGSDTRTNTNNKSGGNSGGGSKDRTKPEKPTKKEVDASIRQTLNNMGRSPSRNRQRLRRARRDAEAAKREIREQQAEEEAKTISVTEFITANEFADLISVPVNDIITKSFMLGRMVSINQRLDAELLSIIGEEYGFEVNFVDVKDEELVIVEEEDDPDSLVPRSPIVTVMGHVDHGKTTLLDFLRDTSVTSQEAGGITQHIGAYEVKLKSGRNVTFLDTPGHEAFTAMRARGAEATDLAIIVIAADDAVMPQTKEAINHAQAAEVPMVFAINKMDKAGADPERIKGQLAEMNLLVEDWGGNYQSQEISALKGDNVSDLLERVILETDLLDLKANPDRPAVGTVIESRLDRGRGNVVTMLVQKGTLRVGDEMVAGIHYGKVRALINQNGERVKIAGPSQPVQVLGLGGQPQAGDKFYSFKEDGKAKEIAQKRSELFRQQQLRGTKRLTLEEIARRRALGNFKELNIIIRADVDGSVEALAGSLLKLSTDEVQVNIVQKAVGAISEADVNLAIASDAIILAFNVRPNGQARTLAEREEVDIRKYSVIYDAIGDVKDALEGLLSPEIKEDIVGTAEVLEVFKITRVGNVAGALVTSGKIQRQDPVRLIRDGVVIYSSKLASLKRFKDDIKEVLSGMEFGFMVENYPDVKKGDILESYRVNEIRRTL